jgi:PAS domain-containing protein
MQHGLISRESLEHKLEELDRSLSELRPPGPADKILCSTVATDRIHHRGEYLYVDPRAEDILGFPLSYYYEGEGATDALQLGWTNILHERDRSRIDAIWQLALAGQPCAPVEYRTDNGDGYFVWLMDWFRPILADDRGHALVMEGCWLDITPRKRRETEFLIKQVELALHRLKPAPRPGYGVVLSFPRHSTVRSRHSARRRR